MAPRTQAPYQGPLTPPASPEGSARPLRGRVQKKTRTVSGPAALSQLRTPEDTNERCTTLYPELGFYGTKHTPIDLTLDSPTEKKTVHQSIEKSQPALTSASAPTLLLTPPVIFAPIRPTEDDDGIDIDVPQTELQTPTKGPSTKRGSIRGRSTSRTDNTKVTENEGPWPNDWKLERLLRNIINTAGEEPERETTPHKTSATPMKFKDPGFVYVFVCHPDTESPQEGDGNSSSSSSSSSSTSSPVVVKVGFSKDPIKRKESIERACSINLEQVVNWEQKQLPRGMVPEKLAQEELNPWKHHFNCKCRTKHGEYFQVSEADALKVVQRWVAFCDRQPWDEEGRLKRFWERRLAERMSNWKRKEHDVKDQRWEEYTRPAFWEKPVSDICFSIWLLVQEILRFILFLKLHRWRLLCLAQWMYTVYTHSKVDNFMLGWTVIAVAIFMAENYKGSNWSAIGSKLSKPPAWLP